MMSVLSWVVTTVVSLAALLALFAPAPAHDTSELAAAITKADEQFCQAVADRNVERFRSFIAENATFNGGTEEDEHGRDAIQKAWSVYFEPGGSTLTWKPEKAEVLPAGEVGYTVGRWERRSKGPDGRMTPMRGNYLTVWRKQRDGAWRIVYDTGSALRAES